MSDADAPGPARRRGRRPGSPDTREQILHAAQRSFVEHGFAGTSLRAVARAAAVDPSLVRHYFGDKANLLLAVGRVAYDPRRLVRRLATGGQKGIGLRIVRGAVTLWESPLGASLFAAIRTHPWMLPAIGSVISDEILEVAVTEVHIPADRVQQRAAMVQAIMSGIVASRYLARSGPNASMRPDEVVRTFGPLVQAVVDGRFDTGRTD